MKLFSVRPGRTYLFSRAIGLLLIFGYFSLPVHAQVDSVYSTIDGRKYSPFKEYRATARKINDLVHTKLAVSFDYNKSYLYGKEWVTLQPQYYPVDSLTLDAKGMDIHQLALLKNGEFVPLQYDYSDHMQLHIRLDKIYKKDEQYTIYIDYTAKPNELNTEGSQAIVEAKGLYFINPKGTDPDKPIQIWTQGETESNSCWFPTIDKPDQKTTEEIAMTVPAKYVTLSTGYLISQNNNHDGTRTDTWRLDKPNAPYLFMMAVGNFIKTEDHWKNIPVDYYLEPAYAPYAKQIFGKTPEMIDFYSRILKMDYPWSKYAQIVVRDYVSGAMENTTATLHGQVVQETPRELLDRNYEDYICHELFHQWFGDYVTTESWSNITLNESMADYAETLWFAYKYGKDKGDENNYHDLMVYLNTPPSRDHNLVSFYYSNREAVFDNVSYQKGGCILNMLRNYVGDSAFFDALHEYLVKYAYGNAEAQQLRLAFEDVTGMDLSWFWDQWYYGKGYPELDISYKYDDNAGLAKVFIRQIQDNPRVFRLPMAIDVYAAGNKHRIPYTLDAQLDTVTIPYPGGVRPDLINVDGDKILLAVMHDHKTLDNYIYQYVHAGNYVDRRQAVEAASRYQEEDKAVKFLVNALKDPFDGIRELTVNLIDVNLENVRNTCVPVLKNIAVSDPKTSVKAAALRKLAELKNKKDEPLFAKALKDPSYEVEGAGLHGIFLLNEKKGKKYADRFINDHGGSLDTELARIYSQSGASKYAPFFKSIYEEPHSRYRLGRYYIAYLGKVKDPEVIRSSIDQITGYALETNNHRQLRAVLSNLETLKNKNSGSSELSSFLQQQIDKIQKRLALIQ